MEITGVVIVTGNPGEGFAVYGPFDRKEDALRWADVTLDRDWWAMNLHSPQEGHTCPLCLDVPGKDGLGRPCKGCEGTGRVEE